MPGPPTSAPLIVPLPGNGAVASRLAAALDARLGELAYRRFPDGESYLRLESHPAGAPVALVCTLNRPDAKVPALLFAADLVRELGACRVGLVAPYLCY